VRVQIVERLTAALSGVFGQKQPIVESNFGVRGVVRRRPSGSFPSLAAMRLIH
jgi:hypothetical protein